LKSIRGKRIYLINEPIRWGAVPERDTRGVLVLVELALSRPAKRKYLS